MRPEIILLIFGMGAVTFLTRFAPFAFLRKTVIPERVGRVMKFIPVAVLSTLIAPAVFLPQGTPDFSNASVPAAVVTLAVALKTKNILLSVLCGMGAVFLFRHWL